jgi:S-adenosylmethionine decarboxylase
MPSSSESQPPPRRVRDDVEVVTVDWVDEGDFSDALDVWQRFLYAVNKTSNLTILATLRHDFPGGGISGVAIIGESHAAIHTWPEHNRAWLELATCGDPKSLDEFRKNWARGPR